MSMLHLSYAIELCFGVFAVWRPDYVWRLFTKRAGSVPDRMRFLIRSLGAIVLVGLAIQATFWVMKSV